MEVSYTYRPRSCSTIVVGLPKGLAGHRCAELCDAIQALVDEWSGTFFEGRGERHGQGQCPSVCSTGVLEGNSNASSKEPGTEKSEAVERSSGPGNTDRLVPEGWPASGTVTLAEICLAWGVSKSTYRRRMEAGKYPKPLEDVGTIAKRYSASDVRDAFVAEMLALHERAAVRDGGMA